ncbi:MAG: hypothetical protein HWE20_10590 [Gammaproteobacteria bacterium]|nr:hypothetical protein [Gammaproteobacteria bacterium]
MKTAIRLSVLSSAVFLASCGDGTLESLIQAAAPKATITVTDQADSMLAYGDNGSAYTASSNAAARALTQQFTFELPVGVGFTFASVTDGVQAPVKVQFGDLSETWWSVSTAGQYDFGAVSVNADGERTFAAKSAVTVHRTDIGWDYDNDGIHNAIDDDDDNDGIKDADDDDLDNDGTPDADDPDTLLDSDRDGVADVADVNPENRYDDDNDFDERYDRNDDGYYDLDLDGDGISDSDDDHDGVEDHDSSQYHYAEVRGTVTAVSGSTITLTVSSVSHTTEVLRGSSIEIDIADARYDYSLVAVSLNDRVEIDLIKTTAGVWRAIKIEANDDSGSGYDDIDDRDETERPEIKGTVTSVGTNEITVSVYRRESTAQIQLGDVLTIRMPNGIPSYVAVGRYLEIELNQVDGVWTAVEVELED